MNEYKHEGILAFGCGCGGRKTIQAAGGDAPRRQTVYAVMKDGTQVSEHGTLPEARTAAVAAGGRVKVSSKMV